ncbi:hypothetical protein TELCIR_09127 [Teladorsagia circumcincta]|uniref:Amine oxidase domain-containing protein n=1 Tax=Teladorsagia circumcincta TaxID=45464 RepID=A0A2G9UFQ4_TELCI|nr:hypothetical protein TELCIR_09127 [Teladorsagia circumcincta]
MSTMSFMKEQIVLVDESIPFPMAALKETNSMQNNLISNRVRKGNGLRRFVLLSLVKDWLDFVKDIEEQFAAEALERSDMSVAERFQELYEQWISLALLNFADWDDGGSEPRSFTLKKKGFRDILEDIKVKVPENRIKLNSVVTKITYSGFGNMMKVFLEYTRPWWPQDANAIAPLDSHSPLAESFPMLQPLYWNKKILVAWVSGKGPQLISKLSDEELVEGLTHHLREALGDPSIPLPVKIFRHSWITDPLVGGSYSYLTPNSVKYVPDAFVRMAEPIIIEDKQGQPDMGTVVDGAAP